MVYYGTIQQQLMGAKVVSEEEIKKLEEERKAGELKAKILSEELDITIARLGRGEITSIEQIPLEQRKYLNIPEGFFGRVQEYQKQKAAYDLSLQQKSAWETARRHFERGVSWYWLEGGLVKSYLRQMWKQKTIIKAPAITTSPTELKPVYSKGVLVGYEDPVRKVTILREYYKGIPAPIFEPMLKGSIFEKLGAPAPSEKLFTAMGMEIKKTPAPLAISAYEGPSITRGFLAGWEATGEAVARLPEGAKEAARGLITEFDPSKGLRYIFEPYKYTYEKVRGEEKVTVIGEPQFGTIMSEEYLLPEAKQFVGTKFEYAEMKGFEPSPELYEPVGLGPSVARYAPAVVETGVLIGAGITPAGAAVVSGYITARGFKQTIEAETIPKKALGVVGIGAGLFGMGMTMRGIQKSITMGELKEAIAYKPQLKLGVRETLKGGIIKDVYRAEYKIGGVKIIKVAEIYTKPISGEKFIMAGRGEVYAKTYEFMTGKRIIIGTTAELGGLGFGLGVGTKGWQPSISVGKVTKQMEFITIKPELAKPQVEGRIYISERFAPLKGKILGPKIKFFKETPEKFVVGGISKEAREKIIAFSGRVKEWRPAWKTPSGIEIETARFKFGIEEVALIKIKKPAPSEIGFIRGTGIKSSQEFFKQLYAPPSPVITEKLIQAPSIKVEPSVTIPSMVGAAPIISKVKLKEIIKPVSREVIISKEKEALIQPSKVREIIKVKEIQKVAPLPKAEVKVITMPKEKLIVAQVVVPAQVQIPKQKLKLKQALITVPVTGVPSPLITPTTPVGFPFPFLPPLDLKWKREPRRIIKVRRMIPAAKYRPSFVSLALGIKAPKIPKEYRRGMGALIVRPIITGKKQKIIKVRKKSPFEFKAPIINLRGVIGVKKKRRKK